MFCEGSFHMNIRIENIGKIGIADIDIDGITVIAGENNTGKSTVGKAVFATFESLFGYSDYIELQKFRYIDEVLKPQSRNLNMLLNELANTTSENPAAAVKYSRKYVSEYTEATSENDVRDLTKRYCSEYIKRYGLNVRQTLEETTITQWIDTVTEDISKIFQSDSKRVGNIKITRTFSGIFNKQIIRIPNNDQDDIESGKIDLTIKQKKNSILFSHEKEDICTENNQTFEIMHRPIFIETSRAVDNLTHHPSDKITETDWVKLLCRPNGLSFYFTLLKKSPVNDNDEEINDYVLLQSENKLKIIEEKLHQIINGKFVKVNDELQFKVNNYKTPFKLPNLSTGLKSFALLLRIIELGVLREKDVLILDEPEINLHPEWQLIYAELIVFMQKQLNLTVLMTTHSPYFLDALEVYTQKYEISDKCNYYLAETVNNDVQFTNVTDNLEPIYKKLFVPFQKLEDLEFLGEVIE